MSNSHHSHSHKMRLFGGSSHPELTTLIANHLQVPIGKTFLGKFRNGETRVEILEDVRGCDVYVVQTGCGNINDHLMELIMMISVCKLGSAARVTAVIPTFPYARQDKADHKGTPMSARIVAGMLASVGADAIISMDIHSPSIQSYLLSVPFENLDAKDPVIGWIMANVSDWRNDAVIVSPDAGGSKRVTAIAVKMNVSRAMIQKQRNRPNEVGDMILFGDVSNKTAIIVDDIADTCGTLIKAASKLKEGGAKKIIAILTHGIFSGSAIENIDETDAIDLIIATNTLPMDKHMKKCTKIKCIDVSKTFADSINESYNSYFP